MTRPHFLFSAALSSDPTAGTPPTEPLLRFFSFTLVGTPAHCSPRSPDSGVSVLFITHSAFHLTVTLLMEHSLMSSLRGVQLCDHPLLNSAHLRRYPSSTQPSPACLHHRAGFFILTCIPVFQRVFSLAKLCRGMCGPTQPGGRLPTPSILPSRSDCWASFTSSSCRFCHEDAVDPRKGSVLNVSPASPQVVTYLLPSVANLSR